MTKFLRSPFWLKTTRKLVKNKKNTSHFFSLIIVPWCALLLGPSFNNNVTYASKKNDNNELSRIVEVDEESLLTNNNNSSELVVDSTNNNLVNVLPPHLSNPQNPTSANPLLPFSENPINLSPNPVSTQIEPLIANTNSTTALTNLPGAPTLPQSTLMPSSSPNSNPNFESLFDTNLQQDVNYDSPFGGRPLINTSNSNNSLQNAVSNYRQNRQNFSFRNNLVNSRNQQNSFNPVQHKIQHQSSTPPRYDTQVRDNQIGKGKGGSTKEFSEIMRTRSEEHDQNNGMLRQRADGHARDGWNYLSHDGAEFPRPTAATNSSSRNTRDVNSCFLQQTELSNLGDSLPSARSVHANNPAFDAMCRALEEQQQALVSNQQNFSRNFREAHRIANNNQERILQAVSDINLRLQRNNSGWRSFFESFFNNFTWNELSPWGWGLSIFVGGALLYITYYLRNRGTGGLWPFSVGSTSIPTIPSTIPIESSSTANLPQFPRWLLAVFNPTFIQNCVNIFSQNWYVSYIATFSFGIWANRFYFFLNRFWRSFFRR